MLYLTRPERVDGAERERGLCLGARHLCPHSAEGDGEGTGGARLYLGLEHLEEAEGKIGEDFSGGGTTSQMRGLYLLEASSPARFM